MIPNNAQNTTQRRGIALMLVMIAILVTGSMAVAYFGSRDNSIAISSNVEAAARARAVAESGLDLAVAILETDADWRTQHVDGVILDAFAFGGGEITVTVLDSETNLPPTESTHKVEITILSFVGGIAQRTQATATIIPSEDEFDVDYSEFALFSQSQLTIRDVASVQRWVASPLSSQQDPIRIGTLATGPLAVDINSWAQTNDLELHTPSTASSMIAPSLSSRQTLPDSSPFPDSPSIPTNTTPLVVEQASMNSSRLNHWAQNFSRGFRNSLHTNQEVFEIQEGAYSIDTLKLNANQPIRIHGNVSLAIGGDLTLAAATIELAQNASLTLHIGGDVDIKSSYIGNENRSTNSWSDPSRVQMYGQNDSSWDVRGFTTIKGEIYAPDSDVELSGAATVCGRIASDSVSMRGASRLLYDQTLDHGGYADSSSLLFNDDGTLQQGVQQLTQLDPVVIDSLEQISTAIAGGAYQLYEDWWSEPSLRPHEVIYVLTLYGVDARRWESVARQFEDRSQDHDAFNTALVQ
jgi:hypothetical protein